MSRACFCVGRALRLLGRARKAKSSLEEGYDRSALTMPALAASCLMQLAWAAVDERDWRQAELSTSRARAAVAASVSSRPVDRFAIDATSTFLLARSGDGAASRNYAQAALSEVPTGEAPSVTTVEAQVILARALMTFEEISRELIVSRTTVKTQAIALYRKLGVKSRAEAVRKAQLQG